MSPSIQASLLAVNLNIPTLCDSGGQHFKFYAHFSKYKMSFQQIFFSFSLLKNVRVIGMVKWFKRFKCAFKMGAPFLQNIDVRRKHALSRSSLHRFRWVSQIFSLATVEIFGNSYGIMCVLSHVSVAQQTNRNVLLEKLVGSMRMLLCHCNPWALSTFQCKCEWRNR